MKCMLGDIRTNGHVNIELELCAQNSQKQYPPNQPGLMIVPHFLLGF